MVVFLGAGTVTNWAQALPDEMNQLMSRDTGTEG